MWLIRIVALFATLCIAPMASSAENLSIDPNLAKIFGGDQIVVKEPTTYCDSIDMLKDVALAQNRHDVVEKMQAKIREGTCFTFENTLVRPQAFEGTISFAGFGQLCIIKADVKVGRYFRTMYVPMRVSDDAISACKIAPE